MTGVLKISVTVSDQGLDLDLSQSLKAMSKLQAFEVVMSQVPQKKGQVGRKKDNPDDADDEFDFYEDDFTAEELEQVDKDVSDVLAKPFFTKFTVYNDASDSDSEGADSQNNDETPYEAWFAKPKSMLDWLYKYFGNIVQPIIHYKQSTLYKKHLIFTQTQPHAPSSLWIHPPEPLTSLWACKFEPTTLFQPCIFLWLIHFFVDVLCYPNCTKPLEKNGTLPL
ncbi:hypothetical protein IW262DRAFT_1299289 [Armillaria fumosa]|nr:hypothetical protein IW262DRAFT_1299289 [Armillaria fumosa]